jgi:hypothetical protein
MSDSCLKDAPKCTGNLKAHVPHDFSLAGPTLAAQTIRTELVDEYHLLVVFRLWATIALRFC